MIAFLLALLLQAPGTVTDLTVIAVTDTTATLSWTSVGGGANYDARYGPAAGFVWYLASGAKGGCATPVAGLALGAKQSCTAGGLSPSTAYTFQMVAFTGTLNLNAVFGGLSNVTTATTVATPPPPPPPPPPSTGAVLVALQPASATFFIGDSIHFDAVAVTVTGNLVPCALGWASSAPTVATVSNAWMKAVGPGTASIAVACGGVTNSASIQVAAPETLTVGGLDIAGWKLALPQARVVTGQYQVLVRDTLGKVLRIGLLILR